MVKRFEIIEDPGIPVVHADNPIADSYTLCGASLDGDNGERTVEVRQIHKPIDCDDCLKIITYVKSIKRHEISASAMKASNQRVGTL